jgi:hypothetical protein
LSKSKKVPDRLKDIVSSELSSYPLSFGSTPGGPGSDLKEFNGFRFHGDTILEFFFILANFSSDTGFMLLIMLFLI